MKKEEYIKFYLRQYRLYEKDLLNTADYVTICKQNYSTFSNRYQQLIFGICSELDSLSKELCQGKTQNFPQRIALILEENPNLKHETLSPQLLYDTKNFTPFAEFSEDGGKSVSAPWWQEYNELKHNRTEDNGSGRFNYQNANLENVLKALSALYILNRALAIKIGFEDCEIDQLLKTNLFKIK